MNAFILHSSPRQARIWQKLLQSQNWSAAILQQETDLRQQIFVGEAENKLPDVILLADNIPNIKLAAVCDWLTTRDQKVPLIALSALSHQELTATQRQLAKAKGAQELLPAFSAATIAIEAIKGVKRVATTVGGLEVQNSALMSCIVALQNEFVEDTTPAADNEGILGKTTITRKFRGQEYAVELPEMPMPKTGKRRYRGQEY
ncbi:response regulator [[Limnothrix rosea] IAM M-220]|uniref:response regulator n=1 Tax=[Limnothrix rosea] IAM M-220 TaxID=454133 RepID=UPI000962C4CC|nr:response regulator [[Limnothrix rosea] IAM M-220]OKH18866.1 hypothetical protein NIES208_03900 [[Limnothrix rosea] IAM M-220]